MSMAAASDQWNRPIPNDNEPDPVDGGELGKCGCIDWHMADCDIRDRRDYERELDQADYDPLYDHKGWEGERL